MIAFQALVRKQSWLRFPERSQGFHLVAVGVFGAGGVVRPAMLLLALVASMTSAGAARAQDSIAARLTALESNNRDMQASLKALANGQAGIQDDLDKLRTDLNKATDKIDALTKLVGPKAVFKESVMAPTGQWSSTSITTAEAPAFSLPGMMMMSSYSASSGGCANGSCGSGRGRLLGRRR